MHRVGIAKRFTFEASHQLPEYEGKCAHLHGHSYKLLVQVSGSTQELDRSGILLDFDELKLAVHVAVVDRYDHKHLNQFFPRPSAESMVGVMFADIQAELDRMGHAGHVRVDFVRLHETETCYAEASYEGP